MPKLTKRLVDAAEPQATEQFIWDSEVPGFGLRVLPSGRKGYVVQYRAGRRSRRISLGPSTVLTCEQARTRAIAIVAAARNGQDPAAERDAGRRAITVKELAERFDREHIAIRVKASTAREYRRNLRRFILPALGQLTVTGITRADVAKFHHDLRHIPYQANRCLEVISKMFSLAELWGLRPDGTNPRKHIRKYPEEKRERFLSAAELRRIGEVLREMEADGVELPSAILAARLLILTGCRLNEIMSLKWSYVDLDVPALRLPDSKTGAKVVHVGQPVVDLLRGARRIDSNPWVITGTLPGKPLSDLQPFWQRVRARAGLKDVRIHDLRHTFASTAVASGRRRARSPGRQATCHSAPHDAAPLQQGAGRSCAAGLGWGTAWVPTAAAAPAPAIRPPARPSGNEKAPGRGSSGRACSMFRHNVKGGQVCQVEFCIHSSRVQAIRG